MVGHALESLVPEVPCLPRRMIGWGGIGSEPNILPPVSAATIFGTSGIRLSGK